MGAAGRYLQLFVCSARGVVESCDDGKVCREPSAESAAPPDEASDTPPRKGVGGPEARIGFSDLAQFCCARLFWC